MLMRMILSISLLAAMIAAANGQTASAPADLPQSAPAGAPVEVTPVVPAAAPTDVPQSAPASAPVEPIKLLIGSDDRIVFLGDELIDTPQRQGQRLPTNFAVLTESFLTVRYPDLHPSYFHMGWIGDTAAKALARLDRDVLVHKPTVVVICLGLNDPGYQPFEPARLEQFRQQIVELVQRCQAAGAKVWLISPPSVEEDHQRARAAIITREGQRQNVNLVELHYNETLGKYAAAVGEVATATGSGYVDWYGLSIAARTQARAQASQTFFTYDGRAPATRSQSLAAAALLRSWGAQPIMVNIDVDWVNGTATVRTHAAPDPVVVPVQVTAEGKRILELKNLPMPWPMGTPQHDFVRPDWEAATLCQYILKISDPPAGGVIIEDSAESRQKAVIPAASLLAGVNLVNAGTLRMSPEVASLASMIALKNTYRYATWRKLELEAPLEPELGEAHARLQEAWNAFASGYGEIVRNRSKFIDLTLVLVEASAAQTQPTTRPTTRPVPPRIRILPPPVDDHDADEPSSTAPGEQEDEGK